MANDIDDEAEPALESPHAVQFEQHTQGVLVAGRLAGTGDLTRAQLGDLKKTLDALGAKHDLRLALVPSGDMTDTGPEPDSECCSCMAIGLIIAAGGTDAPAGFSLEQVQQRLQASRALPQALWEEINPLLSSSERSSFIKGDPQVYLMPVGPLAAATVAFGVVDSAEAKGTGELIRGQDMSQSPHELGVWGKRVEGCSAEGSGSAVVDFSAPAHEARKAAVPNGGYFLVGRYD